MGPFDRFTDRAKRVLALAQDEAVRFNHTYIGPEHLLLGLIREGEGVAARVLNGLTIDLGTARRAIEAKIGRGSGGTPSEIVLHVDTKKVIASADEEAKKLGHAGVATEHLLLGIAQVKAPLWLFEALALDADQVRQAVIAAVTQQTPPSPSHMRMTERNAPTHLGWQIPLGKFDDHARRAIEFARDEAIRLDHNYIGTEHLLAGLLRGGEGLGTRAMNDLGIDLARVRTALEFIIGRGDGRSAADKVTVSPRARVVLELAVEEAQRMGRGLAGTEHLVLGLAGEGQGIASGILESLGVTMVRLRDAVMDLLAKSGMPAPPGYTPPAVAKSAMSQPTESGQWVMRTEATAFDRFGDRAKRVLALAQREAVRMGHDFIGTEHIFLGLARLADHGDEKLGKIFKSLGLTRIDELAAAVGFMSPAKDRAAGSWQVTLTPRTKKVIEIAILEAKARLVSQVEPEHLLLALVREGEGIGAQVLESVGVTAERVRAAVDAAG